jgi:hypothetical protein
MNSPVIDKEIWACLHNLVEQCVDAGVWNCKKGEFAFADPVSQKTLYCKIDSKLKRISFHKKEEYIGSDLFDDFLAVELSSQPPVFFGKKPRSPTASILPEEANLCLLALDCLACHLQKKKVCDFSSSAFYTKSAQGWIKQELARDKTDSPHFDLMRIEKLKGIKLCRDSAWEIAIYSPKKTEFVIFMIIAHQDSCHILQKKQIPSDVDLASFLSDHILHTIEKHKRLPGEILFDDAAFYHILKPLAKALGVQINQCKALPVIASVKKDL